MTFIYEIFRLVSKQLKERKMTSIKALHNYRGFVDLYPVFGLVPDRENCPHAAPLCATLFLRF